MTRQEIFETVARHLFAQGEMAFNVNRNMCMYRGRNGTKCAVGCLIPDEDYRPEMENKVASFVAEEFEVPAFFMAERWFLNNLQGQSHDNPENWESTEAMRRALRDFALNYNLNFEFLNTLSFKGR